MVRDHLESAAQSDPAVEAAPVRRRRRRGILALLAMAVAGMVALAACGGGGGAAPDFTFTLFQGEESLGVNSSTINLSDLYGRPLVLNFWAGLCPPCRAEMPDLQAYYNQFGDRVTLVGVDVGIFTGLGTPDDARNLLSELNISYPAGFSPAVDPVRDYRVVSMPTTIFISPDGTIFRRHAGLLNRDILTGITLEMLAESTS